MFIPLHDDNPTQRTPYVTIVIILINVLCFLYTERLATVNGVDAQKALVYQRGFVPARLGQLLDGKPIAVNVAPPARRVWQRQGRAVFVPRVVPEPQRILVLEASLMATASSLLTCMFLHGSWYHLLSNMWFFWIFGNNIEDRLGHAPFVAFYLGGGLIATACHAFTAHGPHALVPMIGASGAVVGTLGAYAILYPWTNVRTLLFIVLFFTLIDVPALVVLGFWFASQLVNGILSFDAGTGVAWWAHIGGFVAGGVLMWLIAGRPDLQRTSWREPRHDPPPFRGYF